MCLIKLWETLDFLSVLIYFCVLLYTSLIFDRFLFFLKVSHIFFPECISTSHLRHWSSEDWNSIPGNLLNCVLCYMYCKQNILLRVWSEIRREHPSCPQFSHWQLFVVPVLRDAESQTWDTDQEWSQDGWILGKLVFCGVYGLRQMWGP